MSALCQPTAEQILAPPEFTPDELQAMHRWCLKYRDLVRAGVTPTLEQDAQFRILARVTYETGVACES